MAYDSWDDRSSSPGVKLAVGAVLCLGAAALGLAAYTYHRQRILVSEERDARVAEVAGLRTQIDSLRGRDKTLTGRLSSAESELKTKQQGIGTLATRVLRSVFTVHTDTGLASGFVGWAAGGSSYVVTANHVVAHNLGGFVTLSRPGGGSWQGEIAGVDGKNDLAVIRVDGYPAGAAPLWQKPGAAPPKTGDELLLVGSPYGLEGTVTTGVVSRVTPKRIQTDAAANPGNSGGPALDRQGHVIGVLVSGIVCTGLSFAVPIERACAKLRHC